MIKGPFCPIGQNNLLYTLNGAHRALLQPHLDPVLLDLAAVLEVPDKPPGLVYFLTSGVGSTVATSVNGRKIEVGLFGRDGMSGLSVILQGDQPGNETFMRIAGGGLAIDADIFRDLLKQHPTLQSHFLRYVQAIFMQTCHTALSNGQSRLEERLARWLLMCHDRIVVNTMNLTHEFLSIMLGVRRAGVTVGTHLLEGRGLIRASRGQITILDRQGLENEAQDSYGIPESEYKRLIGCEPGHPREQKVDLRLSSDGKFVVS